MQAARLRLYLSGVRRHRCLRSGLSGHEFFDSPPQCREIRAGLLQPGRQFGKFGPKRGQCFLQLFLFRRAAGNLALQPFEFALRLARGIFRLRCRADDYAHLLESLEEVLHAAEGG